MKQSHPRLAGEMNIRLGTNRYKTQACEAEVISS